MLALYYLHASRSLEFSRGALFFRGKPPFTDYGLFSYYHLIDWLQLILVLSPMAILAAVMIFRWRMAKDKSSLTAGWVIAAISGMTYVFISDPENSMAVYLPALVRVHIADDFATRFLAQRDIYYRSTCLSFRDVYWTLREMDRADRWEALLPVKSTDYMNLRGCTYLVGNGENEEALKRLYQTIAKLPYWTEPRIIAAQLHIKLRHFDQAKPQIDTCLMLEPYRKEHLMNLYSLYRDFPNYPEAIKTIQYMMTIFPTDPDIKTDQMIIMLRAGFPLVADSIASFLLTVDSTRAYPYIIKGMIAENRRDTASARRHYNTFLRYGKGQPDTGLVRSRLNALVPDSSAE
jgi:tetratricopeptide (TPR) repeat protein